MTKQIYQIKIELQNSKPKIWRRILVNSDISLSKFHEIIQSAMGWTDSHLHQFEIGRTCYAPKEFELEDTKSTKSVKLFSFLQKEKDKIKYEYDFGDGWVHNIVLEKILPFDKSVETPKCIAGKRNCPPEDCGGIWGYESILEILANPKHEEYEDTIERMGDDFDPDYFDLEETNSQF